MPTGATLTNTAGDVFSGASSFALTAEQLAGLTITPPPNSDVDFQLSVTATSTEADGGDTAAVSGTIDVSVAADADVPTLDLDSSVAGDQTFGAASGTEDQPIALDITSALTDTDSSESLSVTIWGVPTGPSLNHGQDNQDGTWTLSASDLEGLEITPATNDDTDFSLTVTTTATEADGGDQVSVSGTIDVSVAADADAPTLILEDAGGFEDLPIDLDITSALTDTDTSESLSITIEGVPAGATLNQGTFDQQTGIWTLDSDDLSGLQVTPPDDSNDDFTLRVTATITEADGGDTESVIGNKAVSVTGVADTPVVSRKWWKLVLAPLRAG